MTSKHYDVGVIVGRFQVPELTEGHCYLIDRVCASHEKVIIFLGLAPALGTMSNPLDFEARRQMIQDAYEHLDKPLNILYIKDKASDVVWSKNLDEQIRDLVGPGQSVILYGSRDCFIDHYHGKFPCEEIEAPSHWISGTELRKQAARRAKTTSDFRAGVIWAAWNGYPRTITTVDVAVLGHSSVSNEVRLLLVRKPHESLFRFPGGFADPKDSTFEATARREVYEETGVEVNDPQYVGSSTVDDWRYRGEVDKIKTLFFRAEYICGRVQGADDVAEAKWFDLHKLRPSEIVEEHRMLLDQIIEKELVDV